MFHGKTSLMLMAGLVLLLHIFAAGPAFGTDYSWTGSVGNGSVTDTANWSPVGVPGPGDNVVIGNGVAATFSSGEIEFNSLTCQGDLTVGNAIIRMNGPSIVGTGASLTLEYGTIGGTGQITVNGAMIWTRGIMSDAGALIIESNGDLSILGTGTKRLDTRGIINKGFIYLEDMAEIKGSNGALIDNSGTFEAAGNAVFDFSMGEYPQFQNSGTFIKTGDASETVFSGFVFDNYGLVDVQAGSVAFEKGGTNIGTFQTTADTAVTFRGDPYNFYSDPRETFAGNGFVRVENGELRLNYETATVSNLDFIKGSIRGDSLSKLIVTNAMNWQGGTINDALTMEIAAGATLTISGTATKSIYTGSLINNGTVTQTQGANITGAYHASIQNAGLFNVQGNFIFYAGDYPQFHNSGKFVISQADMETIVIDWRFKNAGLLEISGGTVNFKKEFIQENGATMVKNGGSIASVQPLIINSGKLGGAGVISADVENSGNLSPGELSGGILQINGNYTQNPDGVLNIEIASTAYDQLQISGQASLGGTFGVTLLEGYMPAIGESFQVIDYASRIGNFRAISADAAWLPSYNADNISLTRADFAISGVIYQEDGVTPAPGVEVAAWSDSTGTGGKAVTNTDGVYVISGLDPSAGDYRISVHPPGYAPAFYKDNYDGDAQNDTVYDAKNAVGVGVSANRNLTLSLGNMVRGKVTFNNVPVSGAEVEAVSSTGGWGSTVTTDATDQNYEITGLTNGYYVITARAQGYEPLKKTLNINQAMDGVNFTLKKTDRTISGIIENLAIGETAVVQAWSDSLNSGGIIVVKGTGSLVSYTISGLMEALDYRVGIDAENHPYQAYNGKISLKNANLIDLSTENKINVNFTLVDPTETPSISGTVTFPHGASAGEIAFVDIISASTGFSRSVLVTLPGDPGTPVPYNITGLEPLSDYIATVTSDKYRNLYFNPNGNVSKSQDAAIINTTDATPDNTINFVLDPGATISGEVKDQNGNSRIGVLVHAWSEQKGSSGYGVTGSGGGYKLTGLEPGTDFIVSAWIPDSGMAFYHPLGTVYNRDFAALVDATGGEASSVNLIISQGQRVFGTVYDVNGKPLPQVWVSAWNADMKAGNGVFTNQDGSYDIKGLASGQYSVTAIPAPESQYMNQTITQVSAGAGDIDFILGFKGYFEVYGYATDQSGNPASGVRVEIRSPTVEDGYGWDVTDALGSYQFTGLPGAMDYILTAQPLETSTLGFYSTTVQVSQTTEKNIQLPPGGSLSGTLSEQGTGAPVVGARVLAHSSSTRFFKEVQSGKNGGYSFANVPAALDYTVTATSPWIVEQTKTGVSPTDSVDFTIEPAGVISGQVTGADGTAIPGAIVETWSASNQGANFAGTSITNEDGFYSIGSLRKKDSGAADVADYSVAVKADGFPNRVQTGKRPGDAVDFVLLETGGQLSGTISVSGETPPQGTAVAVNLFEKDGDFLTFTNVVCDEDACEFSFSGLDPNLEYQCLFESEFLAQWAGTGHQGVGNDPSTFKPISGAMTYSAGDKLLFNFTGPIARSSVKDAPASGPVHGLDSVTHLAQSLNARTRSALQISGPDPNSVSNNPNITMTWEPANPADPDEGYYHIFNQEADFRITKRNAPHGKPALQRRATSSAIDSDDEAWYFHVAPVDDRGRIGETATAGFYVDTVAPYNINVLAPSAANARTIPLTLGATGASEMYLSNFGYEQAGSWENWQPQTQWQMSEGDGTKKIHIRFRDRASNVADALTTLEYRAGGYGLADVVNVLKILTGLPAAGLLPADIDGDFKPGLAEAVDILQDISGIK